MPPIREQPGDVAAHAVAADFKPAVIVLDDLVTRGDARRGGISEEFFDFGMQQGPVLLQRQTVVAPLVDDDLRDLGLCAHGIDGDHGTLPDKPFEQKRNSGDFIGLLFGRLLTQHKPLAARPG